MEIWEKRELGTDLCKSLKKFRHFLECVGKPLESFEQKSDVI